METTFLHNTRRSKARKATSGTSKYLCSTIRGNICEIVLLHPQTKKASRNIIIDSLYQTSRQTVSDGMPPTTSLQQVEAIILGLQEESRGEDDDDDIPDHTVTSMPLSTYNNGGLIFCSANDATSELERDGGMRLTLDKVTTKEKHEIQSTREYSNKPPGWGAYSKKTEKNNNFLQSIHNPSTHNAIEFHPSEAGHFTVCMLICVYVCACHGVCEFSVVHKCMSQV